MEKQTELTKHLVAAHLLIILASKYFIVLNLGIFIVMIKQN